MKKPEIDATSAVYQAGSTVGVYLTQAIRKIDENLGAGYAKRHPELIAECVRSQTMDLNSVALVAAMYEIAEALEALRWEN
jgi:hypothetical protein